MTATKRLLVSLGVIISLQLLLILFLCMRGFGGPQYIWSFDIGDHFTGDVRHVRYRGYSYRSPEWGKFTTVITDQTLEEVADMIRSWSTGKTQYAATVYEPDTIFVSVQGRGAGIFCVSRVTIPNLDPEKNRYDYRFHDMSLDVWDSYALIWPYHLIPLQSGSLDPRRNPPTDHALSDFAAFYEWVMAQYPDIDFTGYEVHEDYLVLPWPFIQNSPSYNPDGPAGEIQQEDIAVLLKVTSKNGQNYVELSLRK